MSINLIPIMDLYTRTIKADEGDTVILHGRIEGTTFVILRNKDKPARPGKKWGKKKMDEYRKIPDFILCRFEVKPDSESTTE